jgi:hypothetical protein
VIRVLRTCGPRLGERLLVIAHLRARVVGTIVAETGSPVGYVVEAKSGKAYRVIEHLDPEEALEAAGIEE